MSETFQLDVEAIRQRARSQVGDGARTFSYQGDVAEVVRLLNDALATELVCALRYKSHAHCASGLASEPIASEFGVHADQELEHADRIAERIVQLGGKPDLSPATLLERSHADFVQPDGLQTMIRENLIAERIAIDSYRELIRYLGDKDPTTRRMLEDILAVEEEHADELSDWLSRD
ncbi:ferritin-like domain-containing protein [Chitinolyticbacter meiyuanensis]|uniref:ferritin-like domain-containing protein n=1 Tax=Chitinolyticbacter meiyuanensis TaxID=682798 RepID=UPI0011E5D6CB|nr:ferritin-like domain-containing protein [Chitinolyticbacter meiyuanensis]